MRRADDPDIEGWVDMLLADHTDGTVAKYQTWGNRFREWLHAAGAEPAPGALAEFDATLRDPVALSELAAGGDFWGRAVPPSGGGYGYRTRVQAVSAAKSYLDYVHAVRFDSRQEHNVANIVRGEEPAFDPTMASPSQVRDVFENAADCRQRSCHALTVLGYDSILRAIEATRVRRGGHRPRQAGSVRPGGQGLEEPLDRDSRHDRRHPAGVPRLGRRPRHW